jgi:hypothetical protein
VQLLKKYTSSSDFCDGNAIRSSSLTKTEFTYYYTEVDGFLLAIIKFLFNFSRVKISSHSFSTSRSILTTSVFLLLLPISSTTLLSEKYIFLSATGDEFLEKFQVVDIFLNILGELFLELPSLFLLAVEVGLFARENLPYETGLFCLESFQVLRRSSRLARMKSLASTGGWLLSL